MLTARPSEHTRLEAFSDAVFAFALTLLVVSLDVPQDYNGLMTLMGGFLSFACCFALLVWIWHEHNVFFRRYGLQDGTTIVLNGLLLFVVMFYVYPLKFMFDSMFMQFIPRLRPAGWQRMELWQLANASAVYALGFIVLFVVFAALYRHAYRQRERLALTPLEVFDARSFAGHHLVSAGVGLVALAVALLAPLRIVFVSPMCFALMGPAHYAYGRYTAKRRPVLERARPPRPAVHA
jgi:uncharacterized membrane protein